ncbi:tyrosine-type recombinase/integrase [Gallaecimonas mangrovi]|uniref:tyrosine-type recombinase/integrase n=1 Tax=Gallaecimonas mangrovi TaxID=2291597 RepID=UPI000E208A0A|nr:site-specific integrase [Gallaecimonas mangrovi]
MAINKLNDRRLKALVNEPHQKQRSYSDGNGLSIRVTPTGAEPPNHLQWRYRYRIADKQLALVLGKYPDLPLASARQQLDQCRRWLAEGKDPKNERAVARNESLAPLTVEAALEEWLSKYANDKRRNATKHRQQFNKWILPTVGHLPLAQVSKPLWLACFEKHATQYPVAAGYVLQNLKQALMYCRKRGYEVPQDVFELDLDTIGGKRQAKRSRRLVTESSWDELADLVKWLDEGKMPPYYQALLTVLVTFGCRTQEIRLSEKQEWDFEQLIWTVPPEHNKGSAKDQQKGDSGEILRPIPKQLVPWLEALAATSPNDYLLGELKQDAAVSQWGRTIYQKLGHKVPWRLHDIRRSVATGMNELGIAPHIVEQLLGHAIQGVAGIYNRSQRLPEKKLALEKWLTQLEFLRKN